ncbi:MAG: regulatory protein RecX [Rhodospirillales bacterium]
MANGMNDDEKIKGPRKFSAPRLTAKSMENAAVHYLGKFSASTKNLRRVLQNRVLRATRRGGEVPANIDAIIDEVVAKLAKLQLIDDSAFAAQRTSSLRRRGGSTRQIRGKLKLAGIDNEEIDKAVDAADAERGDGDGKGELRAALRLAERRRLGPYRPKDRAEYRQRDMAALARAGFSYDVARKVTDAADAETLLSDE